MKNLLTLLFIALSLQSCGQDKFTYSDRETEQFLIAIAKNAKTIEFEMPNGMKKETKIPVNISIYDKVTEE